MRKILDFFHYFFIPSEKNNLKARALHSDFLTFYLAIALLLTFSFFSFKAEIKDVLGFATDINSQKLFELTNQQRKLNNLLPLSHSEVLAKAAYLKAQDMFQQDYWAHYSPSGESPWEFILASGYKYNFAGENLAKNFLFSKDVVSAWMQSSTHRDNIVRREFSDVGFAVVNGILNGEETTLVVQMFGSESPRGAEPVALETEVSTTSPILGKTNAKNLSKFSFNLSYIFIGFILFVLMVDLYFAYRLNILRVSGKNLAHIIFLMFIFAGFVLYITKGTII